MKAPDFKNEPYDAKKIEALYANLVAFQKNQQPRDYEVKVDDFTIVERTADPSRMMSYADFITPETKYVSVFIFKNNHQSDKYFFHLKQNPYYPGGALNGVDPSRPEESEQKQKEKWRRELHYEELQKENALLKREIEDYKQALEEVEEEKENIKNYRDLTLESGVGLLLNGAAKTSFVKENLPFFAKQDLKGTPDKESEKEHGSFKRKKPEPEDVDSEQEDTEEAEVKVMSEQDRGYIELLKDMQAKLTPVQLSNLMYLLDLVTQNPQSIHYAIKQVSNFLKQKP